MAGSLLRDRCLPLTRYIQGARDQGIYPYFRPIQQSWGTEVEVGGRRLLMIGSNDYLGLTHDPRVLEAASQALRRWGSGTGGSRFLCGNLTLHEMLEERLAAFVGKKKAVVHVTGFSTNLGAIACLLAPHDTVLYDRENHASIFEGCQASRARLIPFAHNDARVASQKIASAREKNPPGVMILITEGIFSMSGDLSALPELVQLKKDYPELLIYLDDAHGLGVMGPGGRGTAAYFNATEQVDFIMGTFSKALAAIGGFVAGDDDCILDYIRHHSRTLIFSAALPASNVATVLAGLDIIEAEPERVERLHEITRRVQAGYREIGLICGDSDTPIIPIHIGDEVKAAFFSRDLFEHGIFALPALFPAVPRGQALIRTAYMSTHKDSQIDFIMEVMAKLAKKHRIRATDLVDRKPVPKGSRISIPTFSPSSQAVSLLQD